MELVKTMFLVGLSAGAGAWVGDKAFAYLGPKLPTQAQPYAGGIKLGAQAAGAVGVFAVLRSVI